MQLGKNFTLEQNQCLAGFWLRFGLPFLRDAKENDPLSRSHCASVTNTASRNVASKMFDCCSSLRGMLSALAVEALGLDAQARSGKIRSGVEYGNSPCLNTCINQWDGGTVKRAPLIAIALLVTTAAFAQHKHPADVRKIDAALSTAQLTSAQRAQVVKYRNEGENLHYAGNHAAAEVVLEKAKGILKIR